ncbi:MAG TPA: GH92 family glycosyl hydrolase [Actinomycetota bacterium]|nr:GH92 family glycosyl hydrolase [Actinomycetota bacterium]
MLVLPLGTAPAAAGTSAQTGLRDLTKFVNPLVSVRHRRVEPHTPITGTSSNGNTFPGADVPFGMLQWSPDTTSNTPGGYAYGDSTITGFSLTHLSGAGCRIFGDFPFLPTTATLGASPANGMSPYDSSFGHTSEQAAPGSYAVTLSRWRIGVRLTTTVRAGIGAFTYPAGAGAHMVISAGRSANGNTASSVTVVGNNEVYGSTTSGRFCGHLGAYTVHFAAQFDHPFVSWSVWNGSRIAHGGRAASGQHTGAFLNFGIHASPATIQAKVAISFVGPKNAFGNLHAGIPGWSFSTIQTAATNAWNAALNRIQVTGGTDAERDVFYTALYHSLLFPSVFSDADGQYVGMDGRVHTVVPGHPQYSNISGWDVYRSEIPLLALLYPQRVSDMVRSLLNDAAQSNGWLPKWPIARMTPDVMDGDSADPIIAGAYAFGARGFPAGAALSRMAYDAGHSGTGPAGYVERTGLGTYLQRGWVAYSTSSPDLKGSAATTLEYATDDFAVARLAASLREWSTWSLFMHRAQNWQRLFNPTSGFLQPRMSDGSFAAGFKPSSVTGYREGDAYQYAWMVPHNLATLSLAMGGNDAMGARLQTFFSSLTGGWTSPSYTGANEIDLEAPWEFDFAGSPWNTQDVVRRILTTLYTDSPSGIPGNDDLGAMSSWYVWAAMGLYPEIPGVAGLAVGSPLFTEIDLHLPDGAVTTIQAADAADDTPYVTSLTVDGAAVSTPWIPLSDVTEGSTFVFGLSGSPDTDWGTAGTPPSYVGGQAPGIAFSAPSGTLRVPAGASQPLAVGIRSVVDSNLSVSWTVSVESGSGLSVTPNNGPLAVGPGAQQQTSVKIAASRSARSGTIVLRAQATTPGSDPVWLAPVIVHVNVT